MVCGQIGDAEAIGTRPPENGEISFSVSVRPASIQSPRSRRDALVQKIAPIVSPFPYLLSGDVSVQITWSINEDERYETDESADVDNIIKPILDALSGPNGIIIDDCQVQHVSCRWISRYAAEEHVDILIQFLNDEFYNKDNLIFVQLRGPFCMPLADIGSSESKRIHLNAYLAQLQSREELITQGIPGFAARGGMSIQRPFHKTRLKGFRVLSVEELGV